MELTNDSLSEGDEIREDFEEEIMPTISNKSQVQYSTNTVIEKCEITTFHKTEKALGNYTTYEITVILDTDGEKDTFNVQRRYSEFLWLHKNLLQVPGIMLPPFPEKDYFNQFTENLIQYRKVMLHNYLSTISKKDSSMTYSFLIAFLSFSVEELELHIKGNPVVTDHLPRKNQSYSFFSWLKIQAPKMKIAGLRKYLNNISVPQDVPKLDEDELDRCSVSAKNYGQELAIFANNICSVVDKTEDLSEKIEDLSHKVDNIRGDSNKGTFGDDDEPKKKLSVFEESMNSISAIAKQHFDLFKKLEEAEETLQSDVENYGYEFSEIARLGQQYKNYLSNIAESNMLSSEYQAKLLSENDLGTQKKFEQFIRELKEFKELMNKCIKIFRINFSISYKQFKMTRVDTYEKMINEYLETVKSVFVNSQDKFETIMGVE